MTAIGSVGEISAPNVRQTVRGTLSPISANIHQVRTPTIPVDRRTPIVDRVPDRPLVVAQPGKVDMQSPGEQQKRQHPVHQRLVEVDAVDEDRNDRRESQVRKDAVGQEDNERTGERHDQRAARRGQPQIPVIDVAEYRRNRGQDCGNIEAVHAAAS